MTDFDAASSCISLVHFHSFEDLNSIFTYIFSSPLINFDETQYL